MSTVLKRGFLFVQVDVVGVVVRFGEHTTSELRRLVQEGADPEQVRNEIADAAMGSRDALIELTFQRDVTLKKFLDEARRNTERVWKAGLVERTVYDRIRKLLPFWFASLKDRGVREDDRMCYRILGDELHTTYTGADGTVYVDQTNVGDGTCKAVLGVYFLKDSDFRQGLIDSLF